MADIEFNCPKCGNHLTVDDRGAGKTVPCPECHRNIQIPGKAITKPNGQQDMTETTLQGSKGGYINNATILISILILAGAIVGSSYILSKSMNRLGDSIVEGGIRDKSITVRFVNDGGIPGFNAEVFPPSSR